MLFWDYSLQLSLKIRQNFFPVTFLWMHRFCLCETYQLECFPFLLNCFFPHKSLCFIFMYGTLYEAKEWNAELNPRGFVFDLTKIPAMAKAHYYTGDEPAAKERKVYLFWLLILLGKTWRFLPPLDKVWPSAENLPTRTLASASKAIQPPPGHHVPWAVSPVPLRGSW